MHSYRNSSELHDQLQKQFPKDFNEGASTDWESVIKQQQRTFRPENKDLLKTNSNKSKLLMANELGQQQWEKYQSETLKAKEELRAELENNMNAQLALEHEEKVKQEKDMYIKKYLFNNYKQNHDEKLKLSKLSKQDFQNFEQESSKKAQDDLLNEEAQNKYKRYVFSKEAMELIKEKKRLKEQEIKQREVNRLEYQQMCTDRFKTEEHKEEQYKQFFKDYERIMNERNKLHSRKVLRESIEKSNELNRIEQQAQKEYQHKLEEKEVKDQYFHQQMLQDTHMHNKSMLDFKQRIQKQQKREKDELLKEQRKKEECDLQLLKIKQQQDNMSNKKQYYADLAKQKFLKNYKEKSSRMLTKDEQMINQSQGLNALIPGINNWNTIGSKPLKRGARSTDRLKPLSTEAHMVMAPVGLPSMRTSKYQIIKDLEKEYYENGGETKNSFNRRSSYNNNSLPNLHDVNPYIEREKNLMMNNVKMNNRSHSLRYN